MVVVVVVVVVVLSWAKNSSLVAKKISPFKMAKKHLTSRHFFSVFPFSLLRLRLIYYLTRSSHLSQTRRRGRGKNLNLLTHFARLRLNERGVLPAL